MLQIHSSDMEPKTDGGSESLTSEKLASIEDEEVLNKMVRQPNQNEQRKLTFTTINSYFTLSLISHVIESVLSLAGQCSRF